MLGVGGQAVGDIDCGDGATVGEPSGFAKPGRRVSKTIAVLDCRRKMMEALSPVG